MKFFRGFCVASWLSFQYFGIRFQLHFPVIDRFRARPCGTCAEDFRIKDRSILPEPIGLIREVYAQFTTVVNRGMGADRAVVFYADPDLISFSFHDESGQVDPFGRVLIEHTDRPDFLTVKKGLAPLGHTICA